MPKTPRLFALVSLALALPVSASVVRAQVAVTSSRTEGVTVAPGGVVTTPFMIRNGSKDSVAATQEITLPAGWRTVNSMAPSMLGADAMELWLVSIAAPAGAPAGTYVMRAAIRTGETVASDTVAVTVEERYSLEVRAANPPTYVLTGDTYETQFIVRNAGNVPTRVTLKATSNRGSTPKLSAKEIDLTAGASVTVKASVSIPTTILRSQQDLLEVIAVDAARDTVRASSSTETTIIAKTGTGSDFWTIPGELAFRAPMAGVGVSPIIASGAGRLTEKSNIDIDFSLRAKPATQSVFGERDEYRLGLSGKQGSIRIGDNSFGFSTLTSSGSQGTGAEVIGNRGNLVAGTYVQKNRWMSNGATELGAMVGTSSDLSTGGSIVVLQRATPVGGSRVASATGRTNLFGASLEIEGATSDSVGQAGGAGLVRLFGTTKTFSYDIGAQEASTTFAGAQRASADQHATISGQKLGPLMLSAMAAIHTTRPTPVSTFGQRISTSTLSATFNNGSAIEYDRFGRTDRGLTAGLDGVQHSLRARGRVQVGAIDFLGTIQSGVVTQRDSVSHRFNTISGSIRTRVGRDQYLSAFGDMTDGKSLGAGGVGSISTGTTAELRFGATALRMTTSMTAQRDRIADWSGQADFTVERQVRRSIIALRGRLSQTGGASDANSNAFFIEVRTPLKLPTSRLDIGGRARAQVIDAATGKGVSGALVRMGEVAAVTDKNGVADFKGLERGEYHAVVEGGATAGQLVSGGDVTVAGATRADFVLNVSRGARVQARLRRFERTTIGGQPQPRQPQPEDDSPNTSGPADTLVDVGAVQQAVLALISAKDTIWQSADDRGRVDFGAIAPGQYKVKVVAGDLPEFTSFEKKEVEINVTAGENREVELRLLPQVRAVQLIGEETVLVAAPVQAAKPAAAPKQRQERQDRRQQD